MIEMAKKVVKAVKKIAKKIIKAKEIAEEVIVKEDSQAKKDYRKFIESYKELNPEKYAQKEQELLLKLESL